MKTALLTDPSLPSGSQTSVLHRPQVLGQDSALTTLVWRLGMMHAAHHGSPLRNLLCFGPPGTGKTMAIRQAAAQANITLLEMNACEFLHGAEGLPQAAELCIQSACSGLDEENLAADPKLAVLIHDAGLLNPSERGDPALAAQDRLASLLNRREISLHLRCGEVRFSPTNTLVVILESNWTPPLNQTLGFGTLASPSTLGTPAPKNSPKWLQPTLASCFYEVRFSSLEEDLVARILLSENGPLESYLLAQLPNQIELLCDLAAVRELAAIAAQAPARPIDAAIVTLGEWMLSHRLIERRVDGQILQVFLGAGWLTNGPQRFDCRPAPSPRNLECPAKTRAIKPSPHALRQYRRANGDHSTRFANTSDLRVFFTKTTPG